MMMTKGGKMMGSRRETIEAWQGRLPAWGEETVD